MDLNILYINIRSLRNKINDIELLLVNQNIDMLLLSETWLHNNEKDNFFMNGYHMIHNCRDSGGGGGIAIYLKNTIDYNIKESINQENNQILIINIPNKNINFGIIYRPPSTNISKFINFFDSILHKYKNTLFVGDININLLNDNNFIKSYKNMLISNGFNILNDLNQPTRVDNIRNTTTIIDHIISDCIKDIQIILDDYAYSDHKIINLKIKNFFKKHKNIIQNYEITNINFNNVILNLNNKLKDLNQSLISFETLSKLISNEILANTSKKNVKYCQNFKEGWFTKELLKIINERNKLYKIYKKNSTNEFLKQKLYDLKRKVRNMVHFNKKKYFENKFKSAEGNSKKIWNIINQLINSKKVNTKFSLINELGNKITNEYEQSNMFNDHFTNITEKVIKKYSNKKGKDSQITYVLENNNSSMYIKKTNEDEVIQIINNLKSNTSAGTDGIKANHLKKIKHIIVPYITNLINNCIRDSIFPSELKHAKVTPVFKDGEKTDVNNYRPISVLSVFSKIYEKILYQRLLSFLYDINYISEFQYGFIKGKNTEIAVNELYEFLYKEFDKKNKCTGIFLDFRKAFDVVNHSILI